MLDVAIEYGVCIPHLCHVPSLSDLSACRLCIVEHVVNSKAKITTSCTLLVQEDMVIHTDTDRIRRLRRNLAELLVAEAPNSKVVQDIAVRCGVKTVRYPFRHNDCVLCGRCVRACNELWGARVLGFVGRGDSRHVDGPFDMRYEMCRHCGACTQLCPMTTTPCAGPMKEGEEYFCGKCESQLSNADSASNVCFMCELGKTFQCARHA